MEEIKVHGVYRHFKGDYIWLKELQKMRTIYDYMSSIALCMEKENNGFAR